MVLVASWSRSSSLSTLAAEVPGYAWELNKGYSAPEHFDALRCHGPSVYHRLSWRLPGLSRAGDADRVAVPVLPDALMDHDGAVRCGPMAEAGNEL